MRQHDKILQCSGKRRRQYAWNRGKEILEDMIVERRESTDRPLRKRERRHMFCEARRRARREYRNR